MHKGKSNIQIVKDYLEGNRPFIQVGYQKVETPHKIGDKWKDNNGITWEQKSWGKVRVNEQADSIREMIKEKCECGQVIRWGSKRDELFFRRTGLCENCLINYETNLRILGVYPSYEKFKLLSNELSFILESEQKLNETIESIKKDDGLFKVLCNSEGIMEHFKGKTVSSFLKEVKKDLRIIVKRKKVVSKAKENALKEYKAECEKTNLACYV